MSAIARYMHAQGLEVRGYDRSPSPLTHALEQEGIAVDYMPVEIDWNKDETLVVYTPAIAHNDPVFQYFASRGYTLKKRAEVLGAITATKKALCVAGTHGKTTTSAMLAHILSLSEQGTNAFLGGISNNVQSNLIINTESPYVVVEADEYDRSFYHLTPAMTAITSIDPDHLDIYGTPAHYQEAFDHYAGLVQEAIVLNERYRLSIRPKATLYTYSATSQTADFHADAVVVKDGEIYFDWVYPSGRIEHIQLGVPVFVNVENATAAMALAWLNGMPLSVIKQGIETFQGVYRRFNRLVNTPKVVYIDDYAHHPTELQASISSVRQLYPNRHLLVVFQPHLYTRTRDFQEGFNRVLKMADETLLLPIYPAREEPIQGVTSDILYGRVVSKERLTGTICEALREE